MRKAHQKALATAVALEEEIEQFSCPPTRSQPKVRTHSISRDCWIHESRGQKRRHCQMQPGSCPASYFEYNPLWRNSESSREVMATEDPDLEEPLELGLEVTSFLRGSADNSEEEEAPSPKPPMKELCKWVAWRAEMCKTPDWWRELLAVPGVPDCKKLVWKVQASFCHPKRASEVNKMENYYQAPSTTVPPQKEFPAASQFYLCLPRYSRDAERENSGICCALQYWAEKTDLPTGGQPCLLAESVKELWEEMRCYLSFSGKEVFEGVTPPEEMSANTAEEAKPTAQQLCLPLPLKSKLPGRHLRNQLQRGSLLNSLDGKKCCTHPSLWWLWGRSLIHQEVWSGLICLWQIIIGR